MFVISRLYDTLLYAFRYILVCVYVSVGYVFNRERARTPYTQVWTPRGDV